MRKQGLQWKALLQAHLCRRGLALSLLHEQTFSTVITAPNIRRGSTTAGLAITYIINGEGWTIFLSLLPDKSPWRYFNLRIIWSTPDLFLAIPKLDFKKCRQRQHEQVFLKCVCKVFRFFSYSF